MKLLIILCPLLVICGCSDLTTNDRLKFDPVQWANGDIRVRGKMVDNIIDDSLLIGKTKKQVIDLLGEQGDPSGNFSYTVDLGLKTGPMGLGGKWLFSLNIHFDTINKKVYEVRCND